MNRFDRLVSFLRVTGLVLVPLFLVFVLMECSKYKNECERLERNQDILLHNGKVEIGRTADGKATASSTALQLSASELKRKPDSLLAVTQRKLKIKNRHVVAAASVSASTSVEVTAVATLTDDKDILLSSDSLPVSYHPSGGLSSLQHVSWSDPWVRLEGFIKGDTLQARIESRDTLQMIVHRVPRRFLFFRFGTKAVRMDVVSQNPHTRLSYPKLIIVR